MIDWEVTEKTIKCEVIGEYVTIMVYANGQVNCSGYNKYIKKNSKRTIKDKKIMSKKLKKTLKCEGLECPRIINYKNKLFNDNI